MTTNNKYSTTCSLGITAIFQEFNNLISQFSFTSNEELEEFIDRKKELLRHPRIFMYFEYNDENNQHYEISFSLYINMKFVCLLGRIIFDISYISNFSVQIYHCYIEYIFLILWFCWQYRFLYTTELECLRLTKSFRTVIIHFILQ